LKNGVALRHFQACAFAALASTLISVAYADAPTHRFAADVATEKVGGETYCSVKGVLSNLGHVSSVPIEVNIWFENNHTDGGESAISLSFPALQVGESSDRVSAEAPGFDCPSVKVKRVEVVCPEAGISEKCPTFYNIAIPTIDALKIERQDVVGK
jgi:hypothetical protein